MNDYLSAWLFLTDAFRIIFMAAVLRLAVILSLLHECLINIMYTVLLRAVAWASYRWALVVWA